MVAALIRDKISAAVKAEAGTGQLGRRLQQQLPQLRSKLVLPEKEPVAGLLQFITDYIESVPGCILLVTAVSKHMGFYDYAAPFLEMAEDYFLHPPQDLPVDDGLECLLDECREACWQVLGHGQSFLEIGRSLGSEVEASNRISSSGAATTASPATAVGRSIASPSRCA